MSKKLLVESDPHETRVAILERDRLTELFIERHGQLGAVGNIYKGRVHRVLPGMQAAFVDVGLARDAFLYVSEVIDPLAQESNGDESFDDLDADGTEKTATEDPDERIEAQAEGALGLDDDSDEEDEEEEDVPRRRSGRRNGRGAPQRSIDQLLRSGQEVVVQVLKDALPNKGARVSTQITLPGRFLVLLPNVSHLGVSRRIEDPEERERLRTLLAEIRPAGMGLIVRTAGATATREDLEADLRYLERLWQRIHSRAEQVSAPTMVHRDLDLALRVARDYLADDFSLIYVDGEDLYERIVEFLDQIQPDLLGRVKLFPHETRGLFEQFELEAEIEKALETKVWLKSGGHIIIHPTEALVAIDVNTGRYVGHRNLEDTVLTTNLEAVEEIVRQIRLRNLGGILVIDLIDMMEEEHRHQVFAALEAELEKDRAKKKVLSISEFGLVELTRKRSRPSLERVLTRPCPYCRGTGRIKSLTSIALELRRQVLRQRHRFGEREMLLRVHPEVADALQRQDRSILAELEQELGTSILIQSDSDLHHERFDILEV